MSWYTNEDIPQSDKTMLHYGLQANYWGFWANRIAHIGLFYKIFRKNYFHVTDLKSFTLRFGGVSVFMVFSMFMVDRMLRTQLWFQ